MNKILKLLIHSFKLKFLLLIFSMFVASLLELLGLGFVIIILNSFLGLENSFLEIINTYTRYFFKTNLNF